MSIDGQAITPGLVDVVPEGMYVAELDPASIICSPTRTTTHEVDIETEHLNGGHYVVVMGVQISLCYDEYSEYICAESQEEADAILAARPYITASPEQMSLTIIEPTENSYYEVGQPVPLKIQIMNSDDLTVVAGASVEISTCDGQVVPLGFKTSGYYEGSWTPDDCQDNCALTATAELCGISTTAEISLKCDQQITNGRIEITCQNLIITGVYGRDLLNSIIYDNQGNVYSSYNQPLTFKIVHAQASAHLYLLVGPPPTEWGSEADDEISTNAISGVIGNIFLVADAVGNYVLVEASGPGLTPDTLLMYLGGYPDMRCSVTADKQDLVAGDEVTYFINYGNVGFCAAFDVELIDSLFDPNLQYVSGSAIATGTDAHLEYSTDFGISWQLTEPSSGLTNIKWVIPSYSLTGNESSSQVYFKMRAIDRAAGSIIYNMAVISGQNITAMHSYYPLKLIDKNTYLAYRYAPIFVYHPDEEYRPITVNTYLNNDNASIVTWNESTLAGFGILQMDISYDMISNYFIPPDKTMYYLQIGGDQYYQREDFLSLMRDQQGQIYCRIVEDEYKGKNRRVIQYWMFYAYNDFIDRHQGDWEVIELVFGENMNEIPEYVTLSVHNGTIRKWFAQGFGSESIELWPNTQHPVIYVARGSHANYSMGGDHGRTAWAGEILEYQKIVSTISAAFASYQLLYPVLMDFLSVTAGEGLVIGSLAGGFSLVGNLLEKIVNYTTWVAGYAIFSSAKFAQKFVDIATDRCANDYSFCLFPPDNTLEAPNKYNISYFGMNPTLEPWLAYAGKWGRRDPLHYTTVAPIYYDPFPFVNFEGVWCYTDGPAGPAYQGDKWDHPAKWGIEGHSDILLEIRGYSPFSMRVFNDNGVSTGLYNGKDIYELQGSLSMIQEMEPMQILMENPSLGDYILQMVGQDEGNYHLELTLRYSNGDVIKTQGFDGFINSQQVLLLPFRIVQIENAYSFECSSSPAQTTDYTPPVITIKGVTELDDCIIGFDYESFIEDDQSQIDVLSINAYLDSDNHVATTYDNINNKIIAHIGCPQSNGEHSLSISAADVSGNIGQSSIMFSIGLLGCLSGFVREDETAGLFGVPIDMYDSNGDIWKSIVTDDTGYYHIDSIPNGDYTISVVTPLGYQADQEVKQFTVNHAPVTVDFNMTKLDITPNQRSRGYWAMELNRALCNIPHDYTKAQFARFAGLIAQHFNNNLINPVENYVVPQPATQDDSLNVLKKLLNFMPMADDEPYLKRIARGELVTMMLNVVAGKVSQTHIVTADGMTLSQAITYSDMLVNGIACPVGSVPDWFMPTFTERVESAPYLKACYVGCLINVGAPLPAGTIPADIMNIAYRHAAENPPIPTDFDLAQNYPNPFNPNTQIDFSLSTNSHVSIEIYNVLGQQVRTLINEERAAGTYSITWDGKDQNGSPSASGVYFYRLVAGDFIKSRKMLLMK